MAHEKIKIGDFEPFLAQSKMTPIKDIEGDKTKNIDLPGGNGLSYAITSRELVRQVPLVRGHP